MARLFTTLFQYNDKTYTAIITEIDGSIGISIPNTDLHTILPNGKAVYSHDEGLEISTPEITEAQSLMVAILTSLEKGRNLKKGVPHPSTGKEVQ